MTKSIAYYIDHTLLKPAVCLPDIDKLCAEAIEFGFAAVCVPPFVVEQSVKGLSGTTISTSTVIGFPMGYSCLDAKMAEIDRAIDEGADELDVVINLIALKNGDWHYLGNEMKKMTKRIHEKEKIIKVIVESGILTRAELSRCCEVYGPMGIDFMKTSTGYAEKGATISDVQFMRANLPKGVKIKASGGIRHYGFASELIEAGADRIGCSSSVQIVNEERVA